MNEIAKILIIDDERGIRNMLLYDLTARGYAVAAAENGEEALELLKKECFDLVISDVNMPKMGGLDTLEAIKKINPDIEVILMTGFGTVETAVAAMKSGAYDFVQKPFNVGEIHALIEKAREKKDLKAMVAVHEASKALFQSTRLETVLPLIVKLASNVLRADDATLMLFSGGALEVAACSGLGSDAQKRARLEMGKCMAQKEAREPIMIEGPADKDPRFSWIEGVEEIQSAIVHPLSIEGQPLGALVAARRQAHPFNNADLRHMTVFCAQIAQAVANAKAFAQLVEEKIKLHTVFTEARDGLLWADAAGRVLLANPAAGQLLGFGAALPATLKEAFEGFELKPPLEELFARKTYALDCEFVRRKPQLLILAGTCDHLVGATSGLMITFRDVTMERREEVTAQGVLSLITHKLRTPLTVVMGFQELMEKDDGGTAKAELRRKSLQQMKTHLSKLKYLIDKLLVFAEVQNPETLKLELAPCSAGEIVEGALHELEGWLAESGAKVGWDPRTLEGLAPMKADGHRLTEALINLIENAVKFNAKGERRVTIAVTREGARLRFSVADNGPGVPSEERPKLFRKFYQIDADFTGQVEGLGLGLAYVKNVAEAHGGEVGLESELGSGSAFYFEIPTASAVAA